MLSDGGESPDPPMTYPPGIRSTKRGQSAEQRNTSLTVVYVACLPVPPRVDELSLFSHILLLTPLSPPFPSLVFEAEPYTHVITECKPHSPDQAGVSARVRQLGKLTSGMGRPQTTASLGTLSSVGL
jgi:hypothetical protein